MNCAELRNLAPLYLSGEIDGELRQRFTAHLAGCPACEREISDQSVVDARLVRALGEDLPDASRVEQVLRRHIAAGQTRRRWIVAGAVAAAALLVGLWSLATVPRLYADAARDHQTEVVEGQPRRWRSGAAAIDAVAGQMGLSFAQAAHLAPAGYSLERAKICGIGGVRALHLVFTNGAAQYSVYAFPRRSAKEAVRLVRRGPEEVAGFATGRFTALVVTVGPAAECEDLARLTAARL